MSEEDRRKKLLWMRTIIIVLAVFIFTIWAFNLRNVWRGVNPVATSQSDQRALNNINSQFNQAITDLQANFNNTTSPAVVASSSPFLSQVVQNAQVSSSTAPAVVPAKQTPSQVKSSSSLSTLLASSTASSSPAAIFNNSGLCPKYINCMPTIGVVRNCQIPPGCENITTLVY